MTKKKLTVRKQVAVDQSVSHAEYVKFVAHLKEKIRSSQIKAAVSVNRELIRLYWEIGKDIAQKQEIEGWGTKIVERVARDLQNSFPGIEGFSPRNIWRMAAFYKAYSILPQAVAEIAKNGLPECLESIPWGHNAILLEKVKLTEQRLWYASMTIAEGWSREALIESIKSNSYKRFGKAITNFHERLPEPHSRLAHDTLKDPYNFDFLELAKDHLERDVEDGLLNHVEKFMREMGHGFSLVGRQIQVEVGGRTFYLDLLFYHLKLRCFVVVELKATDFKPEFAGKMNFYLSAVDDHMKHQSDNPTIGILICREKNNFIVEYALRNSKSPIGVASYEAKIFKDLPKKLESSLPTVQEIEAELSTVKVIGEPVSRKSKKKRIKKKK